MRTPKPPAEDPSVVAAREREQRRAETARQEETQAYLIGSTRRRLRRTGLLGGSGGNVPLIRPTGRTGSGGMGGSGGGGGGGQPGLTGRSGGMDQFTDYQTTLY